MEDFKKIKKQKEEIYEYDENDFESRQENINKYYDKVESTLNEFKSGEINAKDLTSSLGSIQLGIGEQSDSYVHPSAQIFAFESLIKALGEVSDEESVNEIVNEAIFDIAIENKSIKSEYLLGILANYGSRGLLQNKLEEVDPEDDKGLREIDERTKIFENIMRALKGDNKMLKEMNESMPQIKEVVSLVTDDFPDDNERGSVARLVSKYYDLEKRESFYNRDYLEEIEEEIRTGLEDGKTKEQLLEEIKIRETLLMNPTRRPGITKEKIKETQQQEYESIHNYRHPSGDPHFVRRAGDGKWTTSKKINQSEQTGVRIGIRIFCIFDDDTMSSLDFYGEMFMDFIKDIRRLRDKRKFAEVENEIQKMKEKIWSILDEEAKASFGSIKNICIQPLTIQNKPNQEQSKPEKEEDQEESIGSTQTDRE